MNPAVKLLAFYEDVLGDKEGSNRSWEIQKSMQRSAKMRALEGIRTEWVKKWVREWFAETKEGASLDSAVVTLRTMMS